MTEPWLLVGLGAGLLLFGFLAALAFQRWHVPDFLVLMLLGIAIGPGGFRLVGAPQAEAIHAIAPTFMAVAVAFILFEGGVRLPLRGMGRPFLLIVAHAGAMMAVALLATWYVGTRFFGMSNVAMLLFGAATIGPSASIMVSVAPRLRLESRVQWTIVLESVLANVAAAVVVVALIQLNAAEAAPEGGRGVLADTLIAILLALGTGVVWLQVARRLPDKSFLYMATLGVLLAVYAVASGFLGGTGALAAFVFGVVMGNRSVFDPAAWQTTLPVAWDADLGRFHDEITFFVRTFFFVYLGFLFELKGAAAAPLLFACAITAMFWLSRWPSTALLARAWDLPRRERRMMNATLARGLTDAVLILYGIEVGLVSLAEAEFLTNAILLLLLVTAIATGGLIWLTERLSRDDPAPEADQVVLAPDVPVASREAPPP